MIPRNEVSQYKISRGFIGIIQAFGWVGAALLFVFAASDVPGMVSHFENERAWSIALYSLYAIISIIAGGILHAFMAAILAIFDISDNVFHERTENGRSAKREASKIQREYAPEPH